MNEKTKKRIDDMSLEAMLRKWRFAPVYDPLMSGETCDYFAKVMKKKREIAGNDEWTAISKLIGWERS